MSYKRKYKQGGKILSLDALTKQDFVYWHDKIIPRKWFMCWQIQMTIQAMEAGIIRYAISNMNTNELPKEETNETSNSNNNINPADPRPVRVRKGRSWYLQTAKAGNGSIVCDICR